MSTCACKGLCNSSLWRSHGTDSHLEEKRVLSTEYWVKSTEPTEVRTPWESARRRSLEHTCSASCPALFMIITGFTNFPTFFLVTVAWMLFIYSKHLWSPGFIWPWPLKHCLLTMSGWPLSSLYISVVYMSIKALVWYSFPLYKCMLILVEFIAKSWYGHYKTIIWNYFFLFK